MFFINKVIVLFLCTLHIVTSRTNYEKILPDILQNDGLNIFQIATKYNYPIEVHRLVSEDGYLIELHRIPFGHNNVNDTERPAILLGPGLDMSTAGYVLIGNLSLGFTLSEAGYDVWIYCNRGSTFSRQHVNLDPDYKEFWMFDWHEIGFYDYAASIDYIRNLTHQEKIFYIGYSQGATSLGVLLSERPEYNDKIRLAILMGPSIYTAHNKHSLILPLSKYYDIIKMYFERLGLYEIPAGNMRGQMCKSMKLFCLQIVYMITGYGIHIDPEFIPVFVNNLYGGISTRILEHYAQIFIQRRYQKLDYGTSENLIKYGTERPPKYNISKITAPIALFCGRNDLFATCEDVNDLANDLPNAVLTYVVPDEMWAHLDFIYGGDVQELVYKLFLKLLVEY